MTKALPFLLTLTHVSCMACHCNYVKLVFSTLSSSTYNVDTREHPKKREIETLGMFKTYVKTVHNDNYAFSLQLLRKHCVKAIEQQEHATLFWSNSVRIPQAWNFQ